MESEKDIKNELKEIAPDFPQQVRNDPPPGYFDQLPDRIITRWKNEQRVASGSGTRNSTLLWLRISGVAAALLILLLGRWFLSRERIIPEQQLAITSDEAYQNVHDNIDEFETLLQEVEVDLANEELDIPQEDIREYLIEEIDEDQPEELF